MAERSGADVKAVVRGHWNGRAATFDERPNHGIHADAQRRAWLALLGRVAGPVPKRALDLGCGTGFLALLLAELGHRVRGVDFADEMLAIARRKAADAGLPVDFASGDAEAPDEPAGAYDLIVARHVVWTLPSPARALAAWRRLLAPDGRLALVEGHGGGGPAAPEYEAIKEQLPFAGGPRAEQLVALLQETGYTNVVEEPLMDPVLWGGPQTRTRYLVVAERGA